MNNDQSARPIEMPIKARKVLLQTAYEHGQAIQQRAVPSDAYDQLGSYVAEHPSITETPTKNGRRLTFAEIVHWDITLDRDETILGISQSGYGPLMEKLGIDFSGTPFGEDNG